MSEITFAKNKFKIRKGPSQALIIGAVGLCMSVTQ